MLRRLLFCGLAAASLLSPATAADIVYIYDVLGRVVQIFYPNGKIVTYTYDAAGNITNTQVTGP